MTSVEIVKALREECKTCSELSVCMNGVNLSGFYCATSDTADLIERLEKEKTALIEAANPRKLCEICENDSYCYDAKCDGNTCDDCWQYRNCPCANCLSYPKWEWKGPEPEAPGAERAEHT